MVLFHSSKKSLQVGPIAFSIFTFIAHVLTGCGGGDTPTAKPTPAPAPTPATPTSAPTPAPAYANRRLEVINKCTRPMVISVTGGNSELPCPCAAGMTCNTANKQCYFDFTEPVNGWTIAAGESIKINTPNEAVQQKNGATADWSGKVEFQPDFEKDGLAIASAVCPGMKRCPTYTGMIGVSTSLEFTLVPHGPDFYDVSVINGFNIGIEMKPDKDFKPVDEAASGSTKGYNCGAAGAADQSDKRLSKCSWEFDLSTDAYANGKLGPLLTKVDGGHGACTADSACTQPFVCGHVGKLVQDATTKQWHPTTHLSMECGNKIGMWSAAQLCVWSGNTFKSAAPFEDAIDCTTSANKFGCNGGAPWSTSCYQDNSGNACCGCPDWTKVLGIPVPVNDKACQGTNPEWMKDVLPLDKILKKGCPTAYSYQYDDETSTFTCQSAESRSNATAKNTAGYVITLCPESAAHSPAPGPPAPAGEKEVCSLCQHVYNAANDGGGKAFEDLPATWKCPVCGAPKSAFKKQSEASGNEGWHVV